MAEFDVVRFDWNEAALNQFLNGPHAPVARILSDAAIRCESTIKSIMGQVPPPAPPGHAPATRTGRLWGSISWVLAHDALGLYAAVGTNVFYGPFLEGGTRFMAARPFLRPGVEAALGVQVIGGR